MTDTTDQQAVTVAQEDREAAGRFYGYDDEKDIAYWGNASAHRDVERLAELLARRRLASVSSASAEGIKASAEVSLMYLQIGFIECPQCGEEVPTKGLDAAYELATVVQPAPTIGGTVRTYPIPEGMKPWTGGECAPDDWDHGPVLFRSGQTAEDQGNFDWGHPQRHFTTELGSDIVAYTPARVLDLPEPVPATNQAGEVERETIGYHHMRAGGRCDWTHLREAVAEATSGSRSHSTGFDPAFYPGHQMVQGLNYNSLDRIVTAFVDAALATQPATSQEGLVAELRNPWEGLPNGLGSKRGECPQWACDLMQRAANALAATPTPPTLSEDLREVLDEARRQLEYLDGRWPTGTTPAIIARIDAALAKVKAS